MTAPKTDRRILRTRALLRQGLAELMQEKNAGDRKRAGRPRQREPFHLLPALHRH